MHKPSHKHFSTVVEKVINGNESRLFYLFKIQNLFGEGYLSFSKKYYIFQDYSKQLSNSFIKVLLFLNHSQNI